MDCRDLRERLRADIVRLSVDERRHLEACPTCRATRLLWLGSGGDTEVVPRPGFGERLRARLQAEPEVSVEPRWNDALGWAARPMLGVGVASVFLAGALYVVAQRGTTADLMALAESDSVLGAVMADGTVASSTEGSR